MNFEKKFEVFWKFFIDNGGYNVVIEGLRNTLIIAILVPCNRYHYRYTYCNSKSSTENKRRLKGA